MKMNSILLDDSIFDFDSWLTEDILNNLTEEVFAVKILPKEYSMPIMQDKIIEYSKDNILTKFKNNIQNYQKNSNLPYSVKNSQSTYSYSLGGNVA